MELAAGPGGVSAAVFPVLMTHPSGQKVPPLCPMAGHSPQPGNSSAGSPCGSRSRAGRLAWCCGKFAG